MGAVREGPDGVRDSDASAGVRRHSMQRTNRSPAVRASGGLAVAGRERRIAEWMRRVASQEGIAICPETAVCFDCLEQMRAEKLIRPEEKVVVFNTGAAQKYPEVVPLDLPRLDKDRPIDYEALR